MVLLAMIAASALTMSSGDGYRLVWHDEFDKPGRPDPAKWVYENGFVRNQELQWYQPENAYVKDGKLIIEAKREKRKNPTHVAGSKDWKTGRENIDYTSACVTSYGKFHWLYGRLEVRGKIDCRTGMWPAIWTLGADHWWPLCGECDVLEYYGDAIHANAAWGIDWRKTQWNSVVKKFSDFTAKDPNWSKKFHTWRMDWDKDFIKIYLDDELLNTTDLKKTENGDGTNGFHWPHFLLLNLAIGSNGGDPSGQDFPSKFEIDWVRVYQR